MHPRRVRNSIPINGLLIVTALVAAFVGGCSSMQQVEVQNEGPGAVTVTFRFEERTKKPETRTVQVPEGGAEIEALWYGGPPKALEVEAKWPSAVRRQTFPASSLGDDWQRTTSSGVIHGLAVSPDRFTWRQPTLWVRLQNPGLIPLGLFVLVLTISLWMRLKRKPTS